MADVFPKSESWPPGSEDTDRLIEKPTPLSGEAGPAPALGQILAGAAPGETVHRRELLPVHGAHIAEERLVRPVAAQHALTGAVDLAAPGDLPAGLDEAEVDAAAAAEEAADAGGH